MVTQRSIRLAVALSALAPIALRADLPVSYDPNVYRSPQPDSPFVMSDPTLQDDAGRGDKIVTVTFRDGTKRKYLLSKEKLTRLDGDKSGRELFREFASEGALLLVGLIAGGMAGHWLAESPVRRG